MALCGVRSLVDASWRGASWRDASWHAFLGWCFEVCRLLACFPGCRCSLPVALRGMALRGWRFVAWRLVVRRFVAWHVVAWRFGLSRFDACILGWQTSLPDSWTPHVGGMSRTKCKFWPRRWRNIGGCPAVCATSVGRVGRGDADCTCQFIGVIQHATHPCQGGLSGGRRIDFPCGDRPPPPRFCIRRVGLSLGS